MTLRLEHDGPIARLLIDRSDKRNAFTLAMWHLLPRLLEQAAALLNAARRVVILAGGGAKGAQVQALAEA